MLTLRCTFSKSTRRKCPCRLSFLSNHRMSERVNLCMKTDQSRGNPVGRVDLYDWNKHILVHWSLHYMRWVQSISYLIHTGTNSKLLSNLNLQRYYWNFLATPGSGLLISVLTGDRNVNKSINSLAWLYGSMQRYR